MTAIRQVRRTFAYQEGVTKVDLMTLFANALDSIERECHDERIYPAWNYLEIETQRENDEWTTLDPKNALVNEWTNVHLKVPAVRLVTIHVAEGDADG